MALNALYNIPHRVFNSVNLDSIANASSVSMGSLHFLQNKIHMAVHNLVLHLYIHMQVVGGTRGR